MSAPTLAEAFEIIRKPFQVDEIEWRVQRSGGSGEKVWAIVVPYITARAVHDRMDEAFDPWGWRNEFRVMEVSGGTSGIICRTHYLNPESREWDWKENGADQSNIEPFKGGLSDAEKRTFEQFGGGRYLYRLNEEFADTSTSKSAKCPNYAKTPEGTVFYWGAPLLPEFAIPNVRASTNDFSREVTGNDLPDIREYPALEKVVEKMAGKRGISELRTFLMEAKQLGWSQAQVVSWAGGHGHDLFAPLSQDTCIKLRDLIKQEGREA